MPSADKGPSHKTLQTFPFFPKLRKCRVLRALIYSNSLQTAKAAMSGKHLGEMKGDKFISPLGPLYDTCNDAVGPPTYHIPSGLPPFTGFPVPSVSTLSSNSPSSATMPSRYILSLSAAIRSTGGNPGIIESDV